MPSNSPERMHTHINPAPKCTWKTWTGELISLTSIAQANAEGTSL